MNVINIATEIEVKKNTEKGMKRMEVFDWKPVKADKYELPEFVVPETRKKKTQRERFGKVLAFIDVVRHKRYSEGCTIMPIPTTSKKLISICGRQQEVSRLIKFMIEIGLVSVECEEYQYKAIKEEYNKSKLYRYYYDNEQKIIEYCKENNININVARNSVYDTVVNRFKIDSFDNAQVRFSSKLHLLKPDNYSVSQFEHYLTAVLYENYPLLKHYQLLADEINYKYYADYPELSLRFIPSFTWNKGNKAVRKIGIRCTNSLVSAKKNKDCNKNFNGCYKEEVLTKYKLNLDKDVKSSVPRITLSLNTGSWVEENVDIYELIYNEYIAMKYKNDDIDEELKNFANVRDSIKMLHMRGYFDDERTLGVHTRRAMARVVDKDAVDREMRLYKRAVVNAEGGHLYDNEIFFHESCIYMDVLNELLQNGYFVWQCYDAFYAKKKRVTQEYFNEYVTNLVKEKANQYIDTVVEKFKKSLYELN